uniref:Uncharacterized protein n=1 Tax=Panagrellus redivivus TaxID=6233 RepID=A0A7E4V3V8_PANRE
MASTQMNSIVFAIFFILAALTALSSAYPAYGEYYQGNQQPYYNPYGAISGNYGYSSWDASVVNHLLF